MWWGGEGDGRRGWERAGAGRSGDEGACQSYGRLARGKLRKTTHARLGERFGGHDDRAMTRADALKGEITAGLPLL
jgi:hypothetical protein